MKKLFLVILIALGFLESLPAQKRKDPPFSLQLKLNDQRPVMGGGIVYEGERVRARLFFDEKNWDRSSRYYCYVFHYTENEPTVSLFYPRDNYIGENLLPAKAVDGKIPSFTELFEAIIAPPFGLDHFVLLMTAKPLKADIILNETRAGYSNRTELLKLIKGSKLSEFYDPELGEVFIKTLQVDSRPAIEKQGLTRNESGLKKIFVLQDSAEVFYTPKPQKDIVRDSFPTVELIDPVFDTVTKRGVNTLVASAKKVLFRGIAVDWRRGVKSITINGKPVSTYRESSGYFDLLYEPNEGVNVADIAVENKKGYKRSVRVKFNYHSTTNTVSTNGKDHLLIIGINKYNDWPTLSNAKKDAQDFKETMLNQFGFQKENTREFYDDSANRRTIYSQFRNYVSALGENDRLVIYFAGHGYYDSTLEIGYWIPSDAKMDAPDEYINNLELTRMIQRMKAKNIFLIADACYSGQLLRDLQKENSGSYKSRMVLCSGKLKPVPDGKPGQNSPFAKQVLGYLINSREKEIKASNLIYTVKNSFKPTDDQKPVGGSIDEVGDENGDFVFTRKDH